VAFGLCVVGLTLALFSTLTPHSSMAHVIGISMLMAVGMGNVVAPATESIMGSLPRDKAGVGSAVNDTTRQFGGAVGVAVFGSLLASEYTDDVASRLSGHIPAALLGPTRDSIGGALNVARTAPDARPFAAQILDSAHRSFVHGMHTAVVVAMCVLLVAAAIVARFLPARARDEEPDVVVEPAAAPALELADALET
jgi:Na+/melibiose symporter-like transporter